MFDEILNSTIQILTEKKEKIGGEIKAIVDEGSMIIIFSPKFKIEEGFYVNHILRFGDVLYRVDDVKFVEGMIDIPDSYELKVHDVKKPIKDNKHKGPTFNQTINLGNHSRVYQDSIDKSVNNHTQNYNNYSQILSQLRDQVKTLNLDPIDFAMTERALNTIQDETKKELPNTDVIKTLFSMLPTAVQTLAAAGELANMFTG